METIDWLSVSLGPYFGRSAKGPCWVCLKCLDGTRSKFWFLNTCEKAKSDLWNRFKLKIAMFHFLGHPVLCVLSHFWPFTIVKFVLENWIEIWDWQTPPSVGAKSQFFQKIRFEGSPYLNKLYMGNLEVTPYSRHDKVILILTKLGILDWACCQVGLLCSQISELFLFLL